MPKLLFAFFVFIFGTAAAQVGDSTHFVFGYDDSTKIVVDVELEDPLQDFKDRLYVGLGTIGSGGANDLSMSVDYIKEVNANLNVSAHTSFSIQDLFGSGYYEAELQGHRSLKSVVGRSPMKLKLSPSPKKGEEVYYASYPFQARHQLMLDGGFYLVGSGRDLTLNTVNNVESYLLSKRQYYVNGNVGLSYLRTRNVSLVINEKERLSFYTKFRVGLHVGVALSQGADFMVHDSIFGTRPADAEDLESVVPDRLGLGFDLSYELETAKPNWMISFGIRGRALPSFRGDAYFYDAGTSEYQENYSYSAKLLLMPSISVGYVL
jgi:hypothetical protein